MRLSAEIALHTLPALGKKKQMLSVFCVALLFLFFPPFTVKGFNCYQLLKSNTSRLKRAD